MEADFTGSSTRDYTNRMNKQEDEATNKLGAAQRVGLIACLLYGQSADEATDANWEVFKDKTVLDLGCGSMEETEGYYYYPYLPRILAANGARAFGIDIGQGPTGNEATYTHIQENIAVLVKENRLASLKEFNGATFDVINASNFYGLVPSPKLSATLNKIQYPWTDFLEDLKSQALNMLNDGGILLIDDRRYRKVSGELEEIA